MTSRAQLMDEFAYLLTFVDSLRQLDDAGWTAPLAAGKWSTRDVVAHIMLWDKYFLEEAIAPIAAHHPLTLKHLDFDAFNRNAVEYAKTKDKTALIELTIRYRGEILERLRTLSDEEWVEVHQDGDGHPFAVDHYVPDFIAHDGHHIKQLQAFLHTYSA
ncbi:DinB family protein [Paenibacillus cellulosilyticus]|nr:DinB family protein [Paenibacillus cellulosilyticus]QKS46018.1 DinB family protein [Paenibacillus cellulosilyticus]